MLLIVLSRMVLLVGGHIFLRTLPRISDYLQTLETTIFAEFIPAVTGKFVSDLERVVFSSSTNGRPGSV